MDVGRPRWGGISAGGGEARPFKSPPQSLGQVGQMEVVHLIHYTESDVSLTLTGLVCTQGFLFLMQRRESVESFCLLSDGLLMSSRGSQNFQLNIPTLCNNYLLIYRCLLTMTPVLVLLLSYPEIKDCLLFFPHSPLKVLEMIPLRMSSCPKHCAHF